MNKCKLNILWLKLASVQIAEQHMKSSHVLLINRDLNSLSLIL